MAERTMTICDVEERRGNVVAATSHVQVVSRGAVREVDLCDAHLAELDKVLDGLLSEAQPAARTRRAAAATAKATAPRRGRRSQKQARPPARRATAKKASAANPEAVREWARTQGIAVKERGRLSRDLLDKYQAANQ